MENLLPDDPAVQYLPFLKQRLSPERLSHSLGVMRKMGELAEIYSLDMTQARTAGLLHDAAKDLTVQDQLTLAAEAKIEFTHPCERRPIYLHAPVGAYLVAKELGITDLLILDGIATHSYSGPETAFNRPFSWCLRMADLLTPVQEWKGMKRLGHMVYAGKLTEVALLQCGWLIEYLSELDIPVHPTLLKSFRTLSAQLSPSDSFFERW